MELNQKGGTKNESKKIFFDLLDCLNKHSFKHRIIDEDVDLFFPFNDLFVYLDKIESYFFIAGVIEKGELNEIESGFKNKFSLSNDFDLEFYKFCSGLIELLE